MKKVILALLILAASVDMMALGRSKVREYARFLSDRMAYELGLSSGQYDDCYEINYDFVDAVGDLLDDMECGDPIAIDNYYRYLDYRNEDLSYVLSSYQYSRFISTESFYRPFCIYNGAWAFRPYMTYSNRNYFYMSIPFGYNGYYGAHARRYYSAGFYVGRYSGPRYVYSPIRHHRDYKTFHRRDFGPVVSGHGNPRPHGPQARPNRPAPRPDGPQVRPNRPAPRPDGPQVRPNRPAPRPDGPQARPDRPQNKPKGPDVKQGREQNGTPNGGGGGVIRRGRG